MATISYYRPLADFNQGIEFGNVSGSSSRITIQDDYRSESFSGSFRYDYWGTTVTGGTVNGYSYSQGGALFMSISGLSLSAVTVYNLYINQQAVDLVVLMHAGNDTVKGSKYSDLLAGYEGNDTIYGYVGDDLLIGGNGNDLLDGGVGTDALLGGLGNDSYVIDNLADSIIENANEGTDLVKVAIASPGGSYSLGANLENAILINKVAFDLTGNELDNLLQGNAAANRIDGGLGADRMEGGAGNDTYVVDNLGDSMHDSAGIDTVETGLTYTLGDKLENLVLTGSAAVAGTGNALANVLDGSSNSAANVLSGLGGNDTYIVRAGDTVVESDLKGGIDLVKSYVDFELGLNLENLTLLGTAVSAIGNAQINTLTGNDSNNLLDGKGGADKLLGGKGNDNYIVDLTSSNALQDKITEQAAEGNDTLTLRGGSDSSKSSTLTLQTHLENLDASATGTTRLNLTGNTADNLLIGNAANNTLTGGAGTDTLMGGLGDDSYVIDSLADSITENAGEGTDLVKVAIASPGGSYSLGANLENAILINKVAFDLTGNELDNLLQGNAAANRIDGGLGADRMEGGAGNDTYVVDNLGDSMHDSAGIDTVETGLTYTLGDKLENLVLTGSAAVAGTGNALANVLDGSSNSAANVLSGLGGNDTYIVRAGDTVVESDLKGGIDLVKSYVDFELGLNLENLTLLGTAVSAIGNAQINTLTGNDSNNLLDGKGGADKLLGGKGNDNYIVDLTSSNALQDKITEQAAEGNDTLTLRGGSDSSKSSTLTLQTHLENLDASATGTTRLNLTGNTADNLLIGNAANNTLTGGAGNDRLEGGDGADILIGGIGADMLSGDAGNDIFRFTSLSDLGLGESNQDVILDFTHGEDKLDLKALKGYSFKGDGAFNGAKQLRYEEVGNDLVLYGNSGGDLNPDFSIKLIGVTQLQADDLLLV